MKNIYAPKSIYVPSELRFLPDEDIKLCRTIRCILYMLMNRSRKARSFNEWALTLGTSEGNLSYVLREPDEGRRIRHVPAEWLESMQLKSGFAGVAQWFAYRSGLKLMRESEYRAMLDKQAESDENIRQLELENQQLRYAA